VNLVARLIFRTAHVGRPDNALEVARIASEDPLQLLRRHGPARPAAPFLLGARDPLGAQALPEPLAAIPGDVDRRAIWWHAGILDERSRA
jgi:hypothetical protein